MFTIKVGADETFKKIEIISKADGIIFPVCMDIRRGICYDENEYKTEHKGGSL